MGIARGTFNFSHRKEALDTSERLHSKDPAPVRTKQETPA